MDTTRRIASTTALLLVSLAAQPAAIAQAPSDSMQAVKPAALTGAQGKLAVVSEDPKISVTSSFASGWKAVVDRQRGGVITELHMPADGENLVSNDGNRFEGMCNTIYVDFKETGKDGAYVAKGSLYYFGTVTKMAVVEQRIDRVVVEVEGVGGNQVAPKADVCRYRQRYTFLADRIECDGELEWLLDKVVPDSRPELLQMQCMFAPGAVAGELMAWDADTEPIELPQTNSKGKNLPPGLDYPLSVKVPLQTGASLQIHSLQMPHDVVQARFYWNEYPRQIDNKRGFAFKAWEGWPGNGGVRFSADEPIRYRYEVVVVPQQR